MLPDINLDSAYEEVATKITDGDTYFGNLAALHKARQKFCRIIATQPTPTVDQVGPRGLLEYGRLPTPQLFGLLLWRKWLFDIDNRAAQETGYLYAAMIAACIGGATVSARRSPVRRLSNPSKGRQIDCLREGRAYEIKIRVTIAASGQGRWGEELTFPADCIASGYTPVLVVLDPTPNPKLQELVAKFYESGGESHIGPAAWNHLSELAGPTMTVFLEKYVRGPLHELIEQEPMTLPTLRLTMEPDRITFDVDDSAYTLARETPQDNELADISS